MVVNVLLCDSARVFCVGGELFHKALAAEMLGQEPLCLHLFPLGLRLLCIIAENAVIKGLGERFTARLQFFKGFQRLFGRGHEHIRIVTRQCRRQYESLTCRITQYICKRCQLSIVRLSSADHCRQLALVFLQFGKLSVQFVQICTKLITRS